MNVKWTAIVSFILVFIAILVLPAAVAAHGAKIEYSLSMAVDIVATYDSGEPMASAQVVVYAPDEPATPWLTGVCDDEGYFRFMPDTSRPGTWDIQVRSAGHGDMIHIPVGEGSAGTAGAVGYTTIQIVLMAACVVWGSVGTALYFSRRRT